MRRTIIGISIAAAAVAALSLTATAAPTAIDQGAQVTDRAVRGATQTQVIAPPPPQTAQYRVTLTIDWTSVTHPGTLPPNAHVSPPVVAAHAIPGDLFQRGALASPGVELMAETGRTSTLVGELNGKASVSSSQVGASIFGTGSQPFEFTLTQDGDLLSLVTMLAPSPDWFVGFFDRDMFVDGAWVESVTFDLGNYDAGTDSAPGFVHQNADTQPQTPISGPADAPFAAAVAEGPFGTATIERIG